MSHHPLVWVYFLESRLKVCSICMKKYKVTVFKAAK
jgi:uncharacterized Zn-finger protein